MADRTRNTGSRPASICTAERSGIPIIKNKLFSFFSFENWKVGNPQTYARTVPTPLERQGDFSRSLSINGAAPNHIRSVVHDVRSGDQYVQPDGVSRESSFRRAASILSPRRCSRPSGIPTILATTSRA